MTIGDNREHIRVLLYSYYTTITGWGGPPKLYSLIYPLLRSPCPVNYAGNLGLPPEAMSFCRIYGLPRPKKYNGLQGCCSGFGAIMFRYFGSLGVAHVTSNNIIILPARLHPVYSLGIGFRGRLSKLGSHSGSAPNLRIWQARAICV